MRVFGRVSAYEFRLTVRPESHNRASLGIRPRRQSWREQCRTRRSKHKFVCSRLLISLMHLNTARPSWGIRFDIIGRHAREKISVVTVNSFETEYGFTISASSPGHLNIYEICMTRIRPNKTLMMFIFTSTDCLGSDSLESERKFCWRYGRAN